MKRESKCKTCKPPVRHPGCHDTCEFFIKWKQELDELNERIRKNKWLDGLSRTTRRKSSKK